jgi:hypothetical protein
VPRLPTPAPADLIRNQNTCIRTYQSVKLLPRYVQQFEN